MMATLEQARDALSACATIVAAQAATPPTGSCKIGFERDIGPADFPAIRLVPVRLTPGKPYGNRTAEVQLIFGAPTTNAEGLEEVYSDLFDFEAEILAVLKAIGARYIETITDEDRLDLYKLCAIRCELQGTD